MPKDGYIEQERLFALVEFAQQAARLRSKPVATVAQHGIFALHEHQVQGLPGILLNSEGDERWFSLERRHETKPPEVRSGVLRPWVEMTQSPTAEPRLRLITDGASFVAAGTHRSSLKTSLSREEERLPIVDPRASFTLEEYEQKAAVNAQFRTYLETAWKPWAESEVLNRRSIRLYSQLFTLKQQLEGGIVEAQLELVWGTGLGIWNREGVTVSYPLVTRLVELSLNPVTAAVEIHPRDVDAKLEDDWYVSVDNPGVAELEKAAKEFFGKATTTFSPFDRGTFEGLLKSAATFLDANGIYWPNQVSPEDRSLPLPEQNLTVTDSWVLFARPRTNSIFIRDLETLKKAVENTKNPDKLPPAVRAVVTEPATVNEELVLPTFRGVSAIDHRGTPAGGPTVKVRDLYFPKPFNEQQVRIVQLLDVSDGVAVQGPPGTGKTHTIANVICHYLAEGKRVLVTSMKEPALAVLQDQLPKEIRPLAISLLTSEHEGMKQFEYAIQKIASEVQALDKTATARAIRHLEENIDALHARLSSTDRRIGEWATKNLTKIALDGEDVAPQDAAREIVAHAGNFEWIPDSLGISEEFEPRFSDADVIALREARRVLGKDIEYLGATLPQLVEFPDSKVLLQTHQDLSQFELLRGGVEQGDVPALADSGQELIGIAQELLDNVASLRGIRDEVHRERAPWTVTLRERMRAQVKNELFGMLEALGKELVAAFEERKSFIQNPVTVPPTMEMDEKLVEAVANLAQGKSAFGVFGIFGKTGEKSLLDSVRVLNAQPTSAEVWGHVAAHLAFLKRLRELAVRWNALAQELDIAKVPGTEPEHGLLAAQSFFLYRKVRTVVYAETRLMERAAFVFPSWLHLRELADSPARLDELERALRHHLTKNRLANVWAVKERFQKVLEGKRGRIIDEIRKFFAQNVGNPDMSDVHIQAAWSALMSELARVLGLTAQLSVVADVSEKAKASGAKEYARLLRAPLVGPVDALLPDNWRKAWRLTRLATHLAAIDGAEELKKLAKARQELEGDLARDYREVVVKRTWLKLAENASHSIRAALQAYLNAIQKIGKGTGKRAVRYRQDARNAAAAANPAVPCWIMPHYRVSESLPAELGCFDLVVIDEASQSDLAALPALLRAQKVLIVGDDKQVSPEGVGLEEEKVRNLMTRFLATQVLTYRPQMSPDRSIYDLFKVVFAKSAVMLKEHFRCVSPIIEYSKREFYAHELQPLRIPKASERLDPPLIDVMVEDGHRSGDINRPEARFIVEEIKRLVGDEVLSRRSIGVVSLLGDKQAFEIWERLSEELGPELLERHRITCGDARTFQGKERDIMFLSMVSGPNNVGAPLSRTTFEQRFNVAASRARDRMYLVRSVELEHLSNADVLRRSLISHFSAPFAQNEARVEDLRRLCESPFERELYDELVARGYWVTPQVRVGQYRIDMVAEGHNDARLAIECDGDQYHGPEKWADDMQRQRVLERAGWVFWRCFASAFVRRRKEMIEELVHTLSERGVEPIGAEGAPRSIHTEQRRHSAMPHVMQGDLETASAPATAPPTPVVEPVTTQVPVPETQPHHREVSPRLSRVLAYAQSPDQALERFLFEYGLKSEDNRQKAGALWVYATDSDAAVSRQLVAWGFKYVNGKGWWRR